MKRPVVTLLSVLICLHAAVEVANHADRDLFSRWRPLDYAALLFLLLEVYLLERLTRGVRTRSSRIRAMRRRIDGALDEESLVIAFQPILDLNTGAVVGAEALSRFPGSSHGPLVWFAEAEQVGKGVELELLATRAALRSASGLPHALYVSVNVAPTTLSRPELLSTILDGPIEPGRVVVELTEHALVEDYEDLRVALAPLRDKGVRLAIDDTGAGHSSLRHVVDLQPDIIKLDRSLICEIDKDPARRSFVASAVVFALEVGSTVIAEGIENAHELDTLRLLSVDGGQGFLLGRPSTDPREWAWPRAEHLQATG